MEITNSFAVCLIVCMCLHGGGCATNVEVPVLSLSGNKQRRDVNVSSLSELKFLPFITLVDQGYDTSEYWRETELLSLVKSHDTEVVDEACQNDTGGAGEHASLVRFPSRRTVRPICRAKVDYQICPQCPHYSNKTECMLFRDSCRERRVHPSEYATYCNRKYGKWRALFVPANHAECRCCDECVFFRELDQSCVHDEYDFDTEEFLPVTTIDFRAGCNTYWGHPDQEYRALRCDKILRRCVPVTVPPVPDEIINFRRSYRYEPPLAGKDCPMSCRGYDCPPAMLKESSCSRGAFLPSSGHCNCCGKCSAYHQLHEKCAEFTRTVHNVSGSVEMEVEEEFLEPGCDDGLVCRQGHCQDIHTVETSLRRRRDDVAVDNPKEPCKQELKFFKKKYGVEGHLHYNAPQCTPLWLYAPVQCRRFLCYCALEDGTRIEGIKVPRVEVSNMNCDCAREKCRTNLDLECDGYGNYRAAIFTPHVERYTTRAIENKISSTLERSTEEIVSDGQNRPAIEKS